MNDQNLDVNRIINGFQNRLSEAMTQIIVLEAQVESLQEQIGSVETKEDETFEVRSDG